MLTGGPWALASLKAGNRPGCSVLSLAWDGWRDTGTGGCLLIVKDEDKGKHCINQAESQLQAQSRPSYLLLLARRLERCRVRSNPFDLLDVTPPSMLLSLANPRGLSERVSEGQLGSRSNEQKLYLVCYITNPNLCIQMFP